MDDIYKNIEEYKSNNERKILYAFDDMNSDKLSNKKFLSSFAVPNNIRLTSAHYSVVKVQTTLTQSFFRY